MFTYQKVLEGKVPKPPVNGNSLQEKEKEHSEALQKAKEEYEELKESASQQIQQLDNEMAAMEDSKAQVSDEVKDLRHKLAIHNAALKKLKMGMDASLANASREQERLQNELNQALKDVKSLLITHSKNGEQSKMAEKYRNQLFESEVQLRSVSECHF